MDWKQVGLDLATVTARTALDVFPWSGKGDKHAADHAAVESLRGRLGDLPYRMTVVSGEGEKDRAPMLYSGERLGSSDPSALGLDLIVDPLECTTNFARGLPDSMVVLAATAEGTAQPVPGTYMEQLFVPGSAAAAIGGMGLDSTPDEVLAVLARELRRDVASLTAVVQDRERHAELIADLRAAGASIALIESGSISAALEIALDSVQRLNLMWGIFGAPEGLVIAFLAALTGCGFLGRIRPHDEHTEAQARMLRLHGRTLAGPDWMQGPGVLVCSGLHSNPVLRGVEHTTEGLRVQTLLWAVGHRGIASHLNGELESFREF